MADGSAGRRDLAGREVIDTAAFLTIAEVAQLMRVSKMTVYRLVHGGELPAVRFGRSFRVAPGAVEKLIEGARYEAG